MTIPFNHSQRHPASFKDPSGFIFQKNGIYYRQINQSYAKDYELLISSGLYDQLTEKKLLIPHTEWPGAATESKDFYKVILPEQLDMISYPYEWSFDQLKDAALLTLRIAKLSLKKGMMLKDATPFNIQFHKGRPIFIDSLSFETLDPSHPWIAYRQFCETFLFPLLLVHYCQIDAQRWLSVYLDGIPVKTTASLLPVRSRFNLGVWLHVHLQNKVGRKERARPAQEGFNPDKLLRLLDHLKLVIGKLELKSSLKTTWNNYYDETILSQNYLKAKETVFRDFLSGLSYSNALDLGANDGYFSKIMAGNHASVIAADFDGHCVNRLYREIKNEKQSNILPLCIDISNPTAATGFRNAERKSFGERVKADLVVALALIHHLVLTKNIPLPDVALQLYELNSQWLIIEFVPLEDEKSQQLIANKTSFHKPYNEPAFEEQFRFYFEIIDKIKVVGTNRVLYKMRRKADNSANGLGN